MRENGAATLVMNDGGAKTNPVGPAQRDLTR
jgi:hypothetical protein